MARAGQTRAEVARFAGRCHCGNLEVSFATRCADELAVRSRTCSFCRRHGARCVSDPAGAVRILVHDPALLIRYRFGLRTAEFLVCGRCGSYLGALMAEGGAAVATLNVNTFDPPHPFARGRADALRRRIGIRAPRPPRRRLDPGRRLRGAAAALTCSRTRRHHASGSRSMTGSGAPRQVKR